MRFLFYIDIILYYCNEVYDGSEYIYVPPLKTGMRGLVVLSVR